MVMYMKLVSALQPSCTVTSSGHMLALICRLTGLCLAPLESWMGPLVLIQLYKHCYLSAPQWSIHGVTDPLHRQRSQQDLSAPQWSIHGVTDPLHRQRSQQESMYVHHCALLLLRINVAHPELSAKRCGPRIFIETV
jgi:hypothetical protein